MNMHRALLTVLAFAGSLACGTNPIAPEGPIASKTDTLTWELINSINASVDVRFFDEPYGGWYPSRTEYYPLDPREDHSYRLKCNKNAEICFGATVHSNQNRFFGVSVYNNQQCGSQGCCHACDGTISPRLV